MSDQKYPNGTIFVNEDNEPEYRVTGFDGEKYSMEFFGPDGWRPSRFIWEECEFARWKQQV